MQLKDLEKYPILKILSQSEYPLRLPNVVSVFEKVYLTPFNEFQFKDLIKKGYIVHTLAREVDGVHEKSGYSITVSGRKCLLELSELLQNLQKGSVLEPLNQEYKKLYSN